MTNPQSQPEEIVEHYSSGYEAARLNTQSGQLERERNSEILLRFLLPPPAVILDDGGGPGGRHDNDMRFI